MDKLKVYLSGAIKKTSNEFQSWRDQCFDYNQYYNNLKFIDPNRYFNYTNKLPQTERQCLDLFMYQVEQSDILLVNLDHSCVSCGTLAEIEHAFCHNIPIIGFGKITDSWYKWASERCSVIFRELEMAISYISNSYGTV